jgi:hypothetical protein
MCVFARVCVCECLSSACFVAHLLYNVNATKLILCVRFNVNASSYKVHSMCALCNVNALMCALQCECSSYNVHSMFALYNLNATKFELSPQLSHLVLAKAFLVIVLFTHSSS